MRRPDIRKMPFAIWNPHCELAIPTRKAHCTRCWPPNFASSAATNKPRPRLMKPSSWPMLSRNTCSQIMIISRRNFLLKSASLTPYACVRRLGWASTDLGPIRMTNGAGASGLDFVLRNSAQGQKYQVETLPGGLGVIDFDNDGWPDIFCVNGAALPSMAKTGPEYWNRLYRNNRDGTFSDVTLKSGLMGRGYGMGVAVGDYNNDGYEDLFVAGVHGNQLYRNNGNGTFSDVTEQAGLNLPAVRKFWSIAAAWIDYDNDGRLDLFISNYCNWDPGTDQVCGGMAPNTRVLPS